MASPQSLAVIAKYRLTRKKRIFTDPDRLRRSAEYNQSEVSQLPSWLADEHEVTGGDVRGHRCFTIRPREAGTSRHVLYLHGGAYVHQIESAHWRFLDRLVRASSTAVTAPLYPLAPAHQYDEALAMVWAAHNEAFAGVHPDDQVIMGDSAGGGLALFLAQRRRALGLPQPRRLVLVSPWLDITATDPSMPELDRHDPFLAIEGLREAGRLYAGGLDPHDPRVSPIYGDLEGLAPISVFTGTRDVLLADSRRLRALAAQRGVELDYEEYPGMFHGWILQDLPESHEATRRGVDLL